MNNTLPEKIEKESVEKILSIANKMLNDEINLVEGCREISRLRMNTNDPENDVFNIFILVASDTDTLPLGKIRRNFNNDYLEKVDLETEEYLVDMESRIKLSCKDLSSIFSS